MASTTSVEHPENEVKSCVCVTCGTASRYTCPGCRARSCSLACVKAHKDASGCSGARNTTKMVFKEDMNNITILNDYRFLEEIDNRLEDNQRNILFRSTKRHIEDRSSLPSHLQQLRNEAAKRGTTLNFMPNFFSSHRLNTTRYHFKDKIIRWHIKWIFHQADVTFIDCSVDENTSISTLLAKYMNPTKNELSDENNDKLAFYHSASYSRVSVLIKVDVPGSGIAFQELEPLRSLRMNFANKVITEYPVLYVVLKDHLHSYLDYQPQGEGHDNLFSEIEGKEEEQMKDCDADSDKECE